MKHVVFYSFIFLFWNESYSQERFARIIDFDNKPQYANEIIKVDDNYLINYSEVCVDENNQLIESCGGLLKLNQNSELIDSIILRRFSLSSNSLKIDDSLKSIIVTGEDYFKYEYTHYFNLIGLNFENFSLISSDYIKDPNENQINYFQKIFERENFNYYVGCSSRNKIDDKIRTIIFKINQGKYIKSLIIDMGLNTLSWSSIIDNNNLITISLSSNMVGGYDNIHILKFDEDLNQIWHWTADNVDYIQKPYICELHDGRLVVTISDPVAPKIASLEAINPDKSRSWKFRFPDISGKIQRRVYRIKTMQNGDIVGMGSYGNNTMNLDARITEVPYVFRMTSEGRLLWEKAFYRTRPVVNHCIGSIHDVVETENGDLIAVGRLDNYLEYDPVVFQGRPDPDILIIRMDANGCIDDKCEFITKIENVVSSTDIIPDGDFSAYLFPNPSDGSMDLMNHTDVSSMTIFDLNGRMLYQQYEPSGRIDLSGLAGGLYIVHIHLKNKKLIRQNIVLR